MSASFLRGMLQTALEKFLQGGQRYYHLQTVDWHFLHLQVSPVLLAISD